MPLVQCSSQRAATPDLFCTLGLGELVQYREVFDSWLAAQVDAGIIRNASSRLVYRLVWEAFTEWAGQHNPPLPLDQLGPDDLERFAATRRPRLRRRLGVEVNTDAPTKRYQLRVLRLIGRVLEHRDLASGRPPLPTAAAMVIRSEPQLRWADALPAHMDYLPVPEAKRLVIHLSQVRPRPGAPALGVTWQELRNRASVGLQLGAGLTPAEIRGARVEDVEVAGGASVGVPWKIRVPACRGTPAREAPIAAWAGQLLAYWLTVRREAEIAGPWLFPSQRSGRQWGKVGQYNAGLQVLAAAGVDAVKGGSFRLRHTFAIRQLRHRLAKLPPADQAGRAAVLASVAAFLGVVEPKVMQRYLAALAVPEDVV